MVAIRHYETASKNETFKIGSGGNSLIRMGDYPVRSICNLGDCFRPVAWVRWANRNVAHLAGLEELRVDRSQNPKKVFIFRSPKTRKAFMQISRGNTSGHGLD